MDVKAALMADKGIDASHINVDTDIKTQTVILKGSVPTAEQKTAAEKLAAAKAVGYKVVNHLEVVKK
jgi:osmotically-inducible protein OsmY